MIRKIAIVLGAIVALGVIASAPAARASTLLFTYSETGPDAIDVSWEQSSNPVPIAFNYFTYTTVPVFDWMGDVGPFTYITYDSETFTNGGFYTPDGSISVFHLQLYGIPESSPSFGPNVWTGVNATDNLPFTLTSRALPEPATWAMMLLGVGMIVGRLRMLRRKTAMALSVA